MSRIQKLEQLVVDLYESMDPNREDWAQWLYKNHVFWVADKAEEIAKQNDINSEYCRAAALLHDIADAEMSRFDSKHERRSLELARELLAKADFTTDEISLIVDDAIKYHSCRDGEQPVSPEGRVLATADAMAHFQTDFLLHAFIDVSEVDYPKRKKWASDKIEKDFNYKIFFEDIREEVRPQFEALKLMIGNM
jgi:putative nucleotidyltransferase with HDIG domain